MTRDFMSSEVGTTTPQESKEEYVGHSCSCHKFPSAHNQHTKKAKALLESEASNSEKCKNCLWMKTIVQVLLNTDVSALQKHCNLHCGQLQKSSQSWALIISLPSAMESIGGTLTAIILYCSIRGPTKTKSSGYPWILAHSRTLITRSSSGWITGPALLNGSGLTTTPCK